MQPSTAADQTFEPTRRNEPKSPELCRLTPVPFNQIQIDTATRYLVKGLIPREGLTVIWGPPKSGKSFWVFDLTMHVALGWEYRGRRIKQGPVVYVACEGSHGFEARVEAFRQRHLAEESKDNPFSLIPVSLDLVGELDNLIAAITVTMHETKPVIVVFDTLNRSMRGSESSDADMSDYIKAADAVREAFDCAVLIIHHSGHDPSRPRGHTSLTGAADAQIAVKRGKDGTITTKVEWMKDGQEGEEDYSRLETVQVGMDEDGEPITSCVIVSVEKSEMEGGTRLSGRAKMALDHLESAITDCGQEAPVTIHISWTKRVVQVTVWREYCDKGNLTQSDIPDTKNKAFNRAAKRLQELGYIGTLDEFVWLIQTSRT